MAAIKLRRRNVPAPQFPPTSGPSSIPTRRLIPAVLTPLTAQIVDIAEMTSGRMPSAAMDPPTHRRSELTTA